VPSTMTRRDTLAVMVCYNTAAETRATSERFPAERDYDVLAVDDGSSDATAEYLADTPLEVVTHPRNLGLGAAIKTGVRRALEQEYPFIVILAGNGKDDPREIPRLLDPLRRDTADYVQGSRFRSGGSSENLPLGRKLLIKSHAHVMRVLTGFQFTDSINGFRAYRSRILLDPQIDVWQAWLNRYEYETYLHYRTLQRGYRVVEVPVSKTYPPPHPGRRYTHIRPILDWWSIMRPIVLLGLGLRR